MNKSWLAIIFITSVLTSCHYESLDYSEVLNNELELRLESVAGSKDAFLLPDHQDLSSIPQDPRNPLTESKVTAYLR